MRITQEADYALRITALLAASNIPLGAPHIAAEVHIPPRFAMKILRKLSLSGIVSAARGVNGGYWLSVSPSALTVKQVIEAIDGSIAIRHCLDNDYVCSHNEDKSLCKFHNVFAYINALVGEKLDRLTLSDMSDADVSVKMLINKIK